MSVFCSRFFDPNSWLDCLVAGAIHSKTEASATRQNPKVTLSMLMLFVAANSGRAPPN